MPPQANASRQLSIRIFQKMVRRA